MSHHEGRGGQRTGGNSTSAVKAEPSEPEEGCSQKSHGQVMGRHGFLTVASSFPTTNGLPVQQFRN